MICGAYWLTTVPEQNEGEPADLYIWEGGVTAEPGGILFVRPDVVFRNIPLWPEFGENDVSIGIEVAGEFTIGFWGNWGPPFSTADFFIASDEDGAGGNPGALPLSVRADPSGNDSPRQPNPGQPVPALPMSLGADQADQDEVPPATGVAEAANPGRGSCPNARSPLYL